MTKPPTNIPASIRERLLRRAREIPDDFSLVLQRFAVERFLYRLSRSPHKDQFVLKGAMLFAVWSRTPYRPTRDVDLAAFGLDDEGSVLAMVRSICAHACVEDGLAFRLDGIRVDRIRDRNQDLGFRIRIEATLTSARIRIQVDLGYGDAIVPDPVEEEFPTLLPLAVPPPRLRMYPKEAVIAEKLHAMAVHGQSNTRFKDFTDICHLAREFDFDASMLAGAIRQTFERRQTPMPVESIVSLTSTFWSAPEKVTGILSFSRRAGLALTSADIDPTLALLQSFLLPVLDDIRSGDVSDRRWIAGGPWR